MPLQRPSGSESGVKSAWHNARLFQDIPMPKLHKSLALLLALPLVLAGCKINSINYFPPTPAHFRVVNVLGNAPQIDVAANGVVAWSGLPFEAMTGYQDFTNNSTVFSVSIPGTSTPLLEQTYVPAGNENYTLVVYGTIYAPGLGVMPDGNQQQPPSGKFTLSFFNAARRCQRLLARRIPDRHLFDTAGSGARQRLAHVHVRFNLRPEICSRAVLGRPISAAH